MSKNQKQNNPPRPARKLSRDEKKEIKAAIARAKRADKKGISAQETIPYKRMFPDGICQVTDRQYSKTVQFLDINYQLAQNEDKSAIFDGWCDFLNFFDPSIHFQLTFVNLSTSEEHIAATIDIPPAGDEFDSVRAEYTEMLRNQGAKGKNGLQRAKYLTFAVEEDNLKEAKSRMEQIERDLMANFKKLGVFAHALPGSDYLEVIHNVLNMDTQAPFRFSWDWLPLSGLSTKDFIAPSSFSFPNGRMFRMGKKYCKASFLQILAPELQDRILADFLDMESNLVVGMHIQSLDQTKAIKQIKRKITDLDKSKIDEQKKAVRAGYDMDIIPSDLATYGNEAKKLLSDLQTHNERMFLVTFILINIADNKRDLNNLVLQASSIAQRHNCAMISLDYQQEEVAMSCLPLAYNQVPIHRGLTTSATAISKQFITVQDRSGNYFYIIIDRVGETENVYFLNQVDLSDLKAVASASNQAAVTATCTCSVKCTAGHVDTTCPVCSVNMSECEGAEVKPVQTDPEPTATGDSEQPTEPASKASVNPILVIVLVAAMAGIAIFYFIKNKGKGKKSKSTPDFDFDEEDEEYEAEPTEESPEDDD